MDNLKEAMYMLQSVIELDGIEGEALDRLMRAKLLIARQLDAASSSGEDAVVRSGRGRGVANLYPRKPWSPF
jgi:hypothetical protein